MSASTWAQHPRRHLEMVGALHIKGTASPERQITLGITFAVECPPCTAGGSQHQQKGICCDLLESRVRVDKFSLDVQDFRLCPWFMVIQPESRVGLVPLVSLCLQQ